MSAPPDVRRLGALVETVHAVVYFAPEPQEACAGLGLRGYWRGHFASRAAALGAVGPELVTALFARFADGTVLREFCGDAHIAAVAAAGLVWPEPHLLQGATVDPRQQEYRGWSDDEWSAAAERTHGASLDAVEDETDRLTAVAFAPLSPSERGQLVAGLERVARCCAVELPYPNALGLAPL